MDKSKQHNEDSYLPPASVGDPNAPPWAKMFGREMVPRDPTRIPEVLRLIEQVWEKHPDLRLGQLLLNHLHPDSPCPKLYAIEDDQLLRLLGIENPPPVRFAPTYTTCMNRITILPPPGTLECDKVLAQLYREFRKQDYRIEFGEKRFPVFLPERYVQIMVEDVALAEESIVARAALDIYSALCRGIKQPYDSWMIGMGIGNAYQQIEIRRGHDDEATALIKQALKAMHAEQNKSSAPSVLP